MNTQIIYETKRKTLHITWSVLAASQILSNKE
jgi:hypothetical protein